jgi:2-polyprenyl-6-methoxyphenol hydroxylase-like FAD-dependent oxidoreductase
MRRADIAGGSVSGLTLAWLLLRQGWSVDLYTRREAMGGPALVLKDATRALLLDLWGAESALLPPMHRLDERVVQLGSGHAHVVDDASWAARAEPLKGCLLRRLRLEGGARVAIHEDRECVPADSLANGRWHVAAGGRSSASHDGERVAGGCRVAIAAEAELTGHVSLTRYGFEEHADGWLFVAPLGYGRAAVQFMVPAADDKTMASMLASAISRSAVAAAVRLLPPFSIWPAYPTCVDPWIDTAAIRIGDAAMAFDPICGDGTGQALRGALLASASLEAIEAGAPAGDIRTHYRRRLQFAFLAHLRACREAYRSFDARSIWTTELRDMTAAEACLEASLASFAGFGYVLAGRRLAPIQPVQSFAG